MTSKKNIFEISALKSLENGERLLEDAEDLFDNEKYPTSFALAIIAQEEFSKAFIFHLISMGVLKWHPFIKKTLHDHKSKQLVGLVHDLLSPSKEVLLDFFDDDKHKEYSLAAFNSIDFLKEEILTVRNTSSFNKTKLHGYDKKVLSILKGKLEKQKQDAIYIRVNKNGEVLSEPNQIDETQADKIIDKARGFAAINRVVKNQKYKSPDYNRIKLLFKSNIE